MPRPWRPGTEARPPSRAYAHLLSRSTLARS